MYIQCTVLYSRKFSLDKSFNPPTLALQNFLRMRAVDEKCIGYVYDTYKIRHVHVHVHVEAYTIMDRQYNTIFFLDIQVHVHT